MNSIIFAVRPIEPTGQWTTSAAATAVTPTIGLMQYTIDNLPDSVSNAGHALRLDRAMRLGL